VGEAITGERSLLLKQNRLSMEHAPIRLSALHNNIVFLPSGEGKRNLGIDEQSAC